MFKQIVKLSTADPHLIQPQRLQAALLAHDWVHLYLNYLLKGFDAEVADLVLTVAYVLCVLLL